MAGIGTGGYSGTPLPRKLGIRPGDRVALVHAPEHAEALLGALPHGARLSRRATGEPRVVLCFGTRARDLGRDLDRLRDGVRVDGAIWACWPKRASGVASDITEDVVRAMALDRGLVDVKVCAVDATWSGLCLMFRTADRAEVAARRA